MNRPPLVIAAPDGSLQAAEALLQAVDEAARHEATNRAGRGHVHAQRIEVSDGQTRQAATRGRVGPGGPSESPRRRPKAVRSGRRPGRSNDTPGREDRHAWTGTRRTGAFEWCRTVWVTRPRLGPKRPVLRYAASTTSSASALAAVRACAAESRTTSSVTWTSRYFSRRGRLRRRASPSRRPRCPRSARAPR